MLHARASRCQMSNANSVSKACYSFQVLSTEEKPFQAPEPSPLRGENGVELAPVAHKYRRVALGGDQTLVVRCEVRSARRRVTRVSSTAPTRIDSEYQYLPQALNYVPLVVVP